MDMDYRKEELRSWLSEAAEGHFDGIAEGTALGASANIKAIAAMLRDIADHAQKNGLDGRTMAERTLELTGYFDALRGDSSIAVRNAIRLLTRGAAKWGKLETAQAAEEIRKVCSEYEKESAGWNKKIFAAGAEKLAGIKRIMVFDYSSSADGVLAGLTDAEVVVPESRLLNGGYPYIVSETKRGRRPVFIPDVCMMSALRTCGAALIGAETVYPDGSVVNTAGSDIAAVLCRECGVPLYVPTTMIKLDARGKAAFYKKELSCSMEAVLAGTRPEGEDGPDAPGAWKKELRDKVSFKCEGFALVPGELVTGFFTEYGALETEEFRAAADRYLASLG